MSEPISTLMTAVPTEYRGRLPFPDELTRFGGRPGVKYCLVHGTNIGGFSENGWEMMAGSKPLGPVRGPDGNCNNIVVMTLGKPIEGADPMNGRRRWYVDPSIMEETGLGREQYIPTGAEGVVGAEEEASEAPAPAEA